MARRRSWGVLSLESRTREANRNRRASTGGCWHRDVPASLRCFGKCRTISRTATQKDTTRGPGQPRPRNKVLELPSSLAHKSVDPVRTILGRDPRIANYTRIRERLGVFASGNSCDCVWSAFLAYRYSQYRIPVDRPRRPERDHLAIIEVTRAKYNSRRSLRRRVASRRARSFYFLSQLT